MDTKNLHRFEKSCWRLDRDGYARAFKRDKGNGINLLMHRIVINAEIGQTVDHINGNRADNREENLRLCTVSENGQNRKKIKKVLTSSQYKGVQYEKKSDLWSARMSYSGIDVFIGSFTSEISAANAYNFYAKYYHKEFANFNDCPYLENWYEYKGRVTSYYIGVSTDKKCKTIKWAVHIRDNGKQKYIGKYETPLEAAIVYNREAMKLNYPIHKLNAFLLSEEDLRIYFDRIQNIIGSD